MATTKEKQRPNVEEKKQPQHEELGQRRDGHTVAGLFRELRDDMSALVRQQVELSKHEVNEKISRLSRNLIFLLVGSVVAFLGTIYAVTALNQAVIDWLIIGGLEAATVTWLAPLIVGAGVLIIGGLLLMKAVRGFSHTRLSPDHTINSVKEDVQWVQRRRH
ncbi:MAG: phage holin family protein [Chitinivibrionales bacterium]